MYNIYMLIEIIIKSDDMSTLPLPLTLLLMLLVFVGLLANIIVEPPPCWCQGRRRQLQKGLKLKNESCGESCSHGGSNIWMPEFRGEPV